MKRISEINSSPSGISIPSRTETAGLPLKLEGEKPPEQEENFTIPVMSSKSSVTDPVGTQADALPTEASPDTLRDSATTTAPRLVNMAQRNAGDSETSMASPIPLQSNPHADSASSRTTSATASDVLTSLKEGAYQSLAAAQFNMGVMYENGDGVEQDMSQALAWYRLAAQQGHVEAQFSLGMMYETGEGGEQDFSQALAWYRLAAQQGHAAAQCNLGVMYANGDGCEQDFSQALASHRLAAQQGHDAAQYNLGVMCANGEGVEQDVSQALAWYHLAANQGHAVAQFEVVRLYFYGSGINKDVELATYWLLKYGLTIDDKQIIIKHRIKGLLVFVPDVLNKFTEFQAVTELVFYSNWFDEDDFANIGALIKANTTLESLRMIDVSDRNAMMSLLVESLQFNTQLTQLSLDNEDSDSGDRVDEAIEAQKMKLLNRNKAIAELRKELKEHPPVRSDALPFELLIPFADELIINNLKSGKTREETKAALNEFLLSAQYRAMTASSVTTTTTRQSS